MTYHFPNKILGSRISLTYTRFMKSYDELRKNLTKILQSFENRSQVLMFTKLTQLRICRLCINIDDVFITVTA